MHGQYDGTFRVVHESASNTHYRIRPNDIKIYTCNSLIGTFGKAEIETRAEWLIRFFQSRGYWASFRREELDAFYRMNGRSPVGALFGLLGAWFDDGPMCWREPADVYVAVSEDDVLVITDRFIERCANAIQPRI